MKEIMSVLLSISLLPLLAEPEVQPPKEQPPKEQPLQEQPLQEVAVPKPEPQQQPMLFLFRDDKALRVGDVVTVLVTQTAIAAEQSQTQTNKTISVDATAGTGLLKIAPSAGLKHKGAFGQSAQSRKSLTLIATIVCRVLQVGPNGLLKIEGTQETTIDQRKQSVKLSGSVRPQDIAPDNTVLSTQISDAQVEFRGDWRSHKSKSLVDKIVGGFKKLLRIFF